MFANYLIGLREGLEAALVVSILIAYVVRVERRHLLPRIWSGVGLAVAVSLAFGALLTFGSRGLGFQAREFIGGALSVVAVAFVTWMILWMATAGRGLSADLRRRVDGAAEGGRWALALVAMLAVGREGLETALLLWAATQAGTSGTGATWAPLIGAALGLLSAITLGWLIYRGALRINLTTFFTWTGAFLILIAAGVLGYGVHDLQEAGVFPGVDSVLFDVSNTIAADSWYGVLLKGVFNFSPRTTVLQALAWTAYVVPTMYLFLRMIGRKQAAAPSRTEVTAA